MAGAGSFLVYQPKRNALIIIAQQMIKNISISANVSAPPRKLNPEEEALRIQEDSEIDAIVLYLAQNKVGINTDRSTNHFYEIPLHKEETGYVRVEAKVDKRTARWTIYRQPDPPVEKEMPVEMALDH